MRLRALLAPPLILGLVWGGTIWWPSRSAISSANDQIDRAQSGQLSLVAEIDRLNGVTSQLSDLERDLSEIARSIPSDPDIGDFLTTLAAAADQSGVRINLVSPSEILDSTTTDANRPVPAGMTAVSIIMEAEGDFAEVMAFTNQLDQMSRLVVVDHISMAAVDGAIQVIIVDLSLRIFAGGLTSRPSGSTNSLTIDPADSSSVVDAANELDGVGREREATLQEEIE